MNQPGMNDLAATMRMLALVLAMLPVSLPTQAKSAETMPEKLRLWPGDAPVGDGTTDPEVPLLTIHRPEASQANGAALVICPGGGYGTRVVGAEGHRIAQWLNQHGIAGVVLEYRLPRGRAEAPLLDAQRAIRTTRARAEAWKLDPRKIGIIGFSAGGHLASTVGTHFDLGNPTAEDPIARASCRPDFMILIYPVIGMGEMGHPACRRNLLGGDPSPELIRRFSNELHVTPRTPPTFLAHAKNDRVVPPIHSQTFAAALEREEVPGEYLELSSGGHGLDGYQGPMWDAWQTQSLNWLAQQKFIPARPAR